MTEKFLYDSILSRSFNRYDQKKLGHGAFWGSLFIVFTFLLFFNPHMSPLPLPPIDFRLSIGSALKMLSIDDSSSTMNNSITINGPKCTIGERTDVCEIIGDIRINPIISSVFIVSPEQQSSGNVSRKIKPYARKGDEGAMNKVREWTVKSVTKSNAFMVPQCTRAHHTPAVIFSTGGYAGNNFHDYTDVIVPLFLTTRQFNGEVKFLISNRWPQWVTKFQKILENLSNYEFIDIDNEKDVHCFSSVIIGLKRHQSELKLDPAKSPYSMEDFRAFLRNSYQLKRTAAVKLRDEVKNQPRLLLITRNKTRAFLNIEEIVGSARRVGFKVVVAELDSNVSNVAEIVNSCDVMMGVHGAGLTNMVFLPENAVLVQVMPIGGFEWLAETDFAKPSRDMGLRYLEYKIENGESSLIKEFPGGHEVLSDPEKVRKRGWYAFKDVYLDKQNVELNVDRFRPTLLKALEYLRE